MNTRPGTVVTFGARRACRRISQQLVVVTFAGAITVMSAFPAEAAEPSSEDLATLASLQQLCMKARAAERFHIQRRIIKICTDKGRSTKQCETEAAQYGNLNIGNINPEADLPVCKQARAFRQALRGKE